MLRSSRQTYAGKRVEKNYTCNKTWKGTSFTNASSSRTTAEDSAIIVGPHIVCVLVGVFANPRAAAWIEDSCRCIVTHLSSWLLSFPYEQRKNVNSPFANIILPHRKILLAVVCLLYSFATNSVRFDSPKCCDPAVACSFKTFSIACMPDHYLPVLSCNIRFQKVSLPLLIVLLSPLGFGWLCYAGASRQHLLQTTTHRAAQRGPLATRERCRADPCWTSWTEAESAWPDQPDLPSGSTGSVRRDPGGAPEGAWGWGMMP